MGEKGTTPEKHTIACYLLGKDFDQVHREWNGTNDLLHWGQEHESLGYLLELILQYTLIHKGTHLFMS